MRFASAFACVLCLFSLSAAPAIAQDAGGAAPPHAGAAGRFRAASGRRHPEEGRPRPRPRRRRARRRRSRSSPRAAAGPGRAGADGCRARVAGTGGIDSGTVNMSPRRRQRDPDLQVSRPPSVALRTPTSPSSRTLRRPRCCRTRSRASSSSDAQGNAYQRSLQYRGFDSSPVNGAAQGLAVYQNGVRINESFGDIVNWDFLPDNAISGITHPRCKSGLRPQCSRRRSRHRDA